MFDPTKLEKLLNVQEQDLLFLPTSEDERYEYKSSKVKDTDLGKKIAKAASGFWNSGGGLFVIGVGGDGKPDGGLSDKVGNAVRRDWIDQNISHVTPPSSYVIQKVESNGAGLNIESGKAVYLIGFGKSENGPHMASGDNCYYIRAGAHTSPASHFIVEAIRARRGSTTPLIRHIIRRKPGNSRVIQLGIIALTAVPAIDVFIEFIPFPESLKRWTMKEFSLKVPLISEQFPYFLDISIMNFPMNLRLKNQPFCVKLTYFDTIKRKYEETFNVDIDSQIGPNLSSESGYENIGHELADIKRAIEAIARQMNGY